MTKDDIITGYMMVPKITIAEMLFDTITRYEDNIKELTSRTCERCRYFVELMNHPTKDGYCDNKYLGTYTTDEPEDIAFDVNKDFGCNKWRINDKRRSKTIYS